MNEEDINPEEGLEEDIKRNLDQANKDYQEKTKGNEEIRRLRESRRGTGVGDTQLDIPGIFEARSGFRTTAALGTEIFLNTLVDPLFEPTTQVAAGTAINFLAQRIRGGELSKGELAASGLASLIPGGAQGRAITQFAKGAGRGALSGGIESLGIAGIDRGQLPSLGEFGTSVGIGAAFGGALSTPQAAKAIQDLRGRITGQYKPITAYAATIDPDDIPRTPIGEWVTVGRKSQPLNFLFGRDAGWRGGLLNLKSWRDHPLKGNKNIAEQFLTAQGKGVVFSTEATKKNAFMSRIMGITGAERLLQLPPASKNIFQAHHKTATKAVLTGQEGLVYDSNRYHQIQKVWEDLELTLGNNPDNIIGTIGLVQRDLDSPHSLIHKFLDSKMGKDGTKFWTRELMEQIVEYDDLGNAIGQKNFDLRLAKTKEQALIFKEAVDLLNLAHRQYYLARGVKPGEYLSTEPIFNEEMVDSFFNKLPPKGGTGPYNTQVISRIVKEISDEANVTPTIKSGGLKQLADEAIADDVKDMIEKAEKIAITSANGESMVLDLILNFPNLKPKAAIKKWTGNDPLMTTQKSVQLEKELKELTKSGAAQRLKQLYQRTFGNIPPAVTKFDKGADD